MSWIVEIWLTSGTRVTSTNGDQAGAQSVYTQLESALGGQQQWQYNWGDNHLNVRLSAVVAYAMREASAGPSQAEISDAFSGKGMTPPGYST